MREPHEKKKKRRKERKGKERLKMSQEMIAVRDYSYGLFSSAMYMYIFLTEDCLKVTVWPRRLPHGF